MFRCVENVVPSNCSFFVMRSSAFFLSFYINSVLLQGSVCVLRLFNKLFT